MMEDNELITDDNIARVKDLLVSMESGNEEDAIEIIDELTTIRETELYQDMGKLTRELHDAISNFGMDDSINIMAEQSIPDANVCGLSKSEAELVSMMHRLDKAS